MKMTQKIFPAPLYNFLEYTHDAQVEQIILDCGAGGNFPKLALFAIHGFETYGIEISEERIQNAEDYAKKNGFNLNITKGDMRKLPYENEAFGFVYSYNTIFHMNKEEIAEALNEMFRVLKKQGLIYVNLLSIDDSSYGIGKEISSSTFMDEENGEQFSHTYL
jgi:ubiquinone/menaquinone biosynthesis C-methylase UbiE